jgi:chloride channel, nucleotide-sensitive, 1A
MFSQRPSFRQFVDRTPEGAPVLRDDEEIILTCVVELYFEPSSSLGEGTCYVTGSRVLWLGENRVFDYDVAYIGLHAITHDPSSFPKPCIYLQFDEEDDSYQQECFFVPKAPPLGNGDEAEEAFERSLRALFDALSKAASMNPDGDANDGDDAAGDFIFNPDEVQMGAQQAQALEHLDSVFHLEGDVAAESLANCHPDSSSN